MSTKPFDILLINLDAEIVVLTNNAIVPITNFYDEFGEECSSEDPAMIVAGSDEYGWYSIHMSEFEAPTVH